jgi:hypothetical protein
MPNKKYDGIDRSELKKLLARFFDKGIEISDDMLSQADKYLFRGAADTKRGTDPALQQTLNYLRNVMRRNHFKDLDDLVLYYDKKRSKISDLYKRLESVDPEECFAISFRDACTLYMQIIPNQDAVKSDDSRHIQKDSSKATREEGAQITSTVDEKKLTGRGCTGVRKFNELECN